MSPVDGRLPLPPVLPPSPSSSPHDVRHAQHAIVMKTNDAECSRELIPDRILLLFILDRILLLFILVCFVLCYDVLCLSSARNGDKARRHIRVRFLFKVSYICNNVQTVFSGVCAQCALCLSLWCEMDVIRSIFLYAGMLRNAVPVMADAVKDRRVGWFLSSFCP